MILPYSPIPEQPWPELEALMRPRLPPVKAAAIGRLRFAADRNASLLGLALLAHACAKLGLPCRLETLEFPARGKPRLPGGPAFSISHGGGWVACAAAPDGAIGLDLEAPGRVSPAMLRRLAGGGERAVLARTRRDPTGYAVACEAVVKAAGATVAELGLVRLDEDHAWFRGVRYELSAPPLDAPLVVALADSQAGRTASLARLTPHELLTLASAR